MGNLYITSGNIKNLVGRQVFDSSYKNDYGIGVIVSTFEVSGELGCRVHYNLDRLVLKHTGAMSGVDVAGPVSGTINTGASYVSWDAMSEAYTLANPSERGSAMRGMWYEPQVRSGSIGLVSAGKDFGLVREEYFDGTVDYYPEIFNGISGTIALLKLV